METNEFHKRLKDDPELAQNLKEALGRNAGADELSGILSDGGIGAESVDALMAKYHRKRGEQIASQELDDEALDQVAGGLTVDMWFKNNECSNQFSTGKYALGREVCDFNTYCDDYFIFL